MVAPVEVGEGGIDLLVSSGLLKEHKTRDRKAVGEACLVALEQRSMVNSSYPPKRWPLPRIAQGPRALIH